MNLSNCFGNNSCWLIVLLLLILFNENGCGNDSRGGHGCFDC